jgi:hypothetical protein
MAKRNLSKTKKIEEAEEKPEGKILDLGHWSCPFIFDPDDWIGFIYLITDKINGRKYIGKKFFHSTTRKKVKNRVNRKKVVKESNWRSYTSSSKEINAIIEVDGKDRFTFEIVSLHESRGSLAYAEVHAIITQGALIDVFEDGTRKFYNGMVPPIKFNIKPLTEREKEFRVC